MSKITLTSLMLPLILLLGGSSGNYAAQSKQKRSDATTGIFQKLIVQDGSVSIALDVNRLNGINSIAQKTGAPTWISDLRFAIAANSFFTILAYNDVLRGPEQGSMALVLKDAQVGYGTLPGAPDRLTNSLWKNFRPTRNQSRRRDAKQALRFSTRGRALRLRRSGAVADHKRWPAAHFERVC
jgi:hypothetical protein